MPAFLVVRSGLPPKAIALPDGSLVVGRAPEVDFTLAHVEISRRHCRFAWDGNACTVQDLGSVCGTTVNGQRLAAPVELKPGDRIGVGPVTLEFGLGDPPAIDQTVPAAVAARMLVRGKPAERVIVDRELVIGRDAKADVILTDPGVSRRHACLRPLPGGGCMVADLNSTGGSFINGLRFDERQLTVGDRLQVGPFFFQYDGESLTLASNISGGSLHTIGLCNRTGTQTILDEITVTIPPSRFVGIIGPSGAGKSSLLHAAAGLRAPTSGVVLIDGVDLYDAGSAPSIGFVPQDDIVHPELTANEALRYSALLRLPRGTPKSEMEKLLAQTLDQLRLTQRAQLPIARLSGGQRKRVSVGVELLVRPSILFLDEPTSGLDPATEFQLMELLRDLADTGCTIVCTTHVMENAYLMDQLVVLVGGCLAFQGSPQEARDYFDAAKLSALYDRLDEKPPKTWREEFRNKFPDHSGPAATEPVSTAPPRKPRRRLALPILLRRQWAILRSDWRNFLILLGQPLVIAALVCWTSDDRSLILFFAYLATLWFGCSNAAQEIVKEIAIYRRERLIGISGHAYLISKFAFLIAVSTIQALLIYGCVLLFEGGRDGSVKWQIAALLGTAVAGVGVGSAISALARSVMQAVMIVPLILIPQIIFSGHPVPPTEMRSTYIEKLEKRGVDSEEAAKRTSPVLMVSRLMPTFCAQTMMDTSFLWNREIEGELMSKHGQSYRNLDPERDFATGDVFTRTRPAWFALLGHGLWLIGSYLVAWLALRLKERR
jgi:ABC-type multidrug transport system ATPase subunit/pSer/pThr/pTyr-binding forkhead associated (FHA) protein